MGLYRRKNSPKWYGEYTDATGRRVQKSTGTHIKRDAAAVLSQWQTEANNIRQGVSVAPNTNLETLLVEYLQYLGGRSDIHQSKTESRIRRVLTACNFEYPRDLDQIKIEIAIRGFIVKGKPISLRTQGHYLGAMKSFSRWLCNIKKATLRDELAGIRKPNFERDRKKKRRYLTPEEWYWLAQTPNALTYEVAIQTGLRAAELRALRPEHIKSDRIVLPGRHTKNGQDATLYIDPDLAKRLARAIPLHIPVRTADMLYADLETARGLWVATKPKNRPQGFLAPLNASDECLDFHALRHTCGAWLAIADVGIKTIQAIMRHSTITLTLDTYGHLLPGKEQDAARRLSVILTQTLRTEGDRRRT